MDGNTAMDNSAGSDGEDLKKRIPSLVVSLVIPSIKDVNLLKLCRLVCKEWNDFACDSMKNRCMATIEEKSYSHRNVKEFKELLGMNSLGPMDSLPLPFKYFNVVPDTFSENHFEEFILMPQVLSDKLSIEFIHRIEQTKFNQGLKRLLLVKQAEIRSLTLECGYYHLNHVAKFPDEIPNDEIVLSSLKNLVVQDPDGLSNEFLKSVLKYPALETLNFKAEKGENFLYLLQNISTHQLNHLDVRVWDIPDDDGWTGLMKLNLPRLKVLRFFVRTYDYDYQNPYDFFEKYLSFIEKVSAKLEYLEVLLFPNAILFPVLRVIELHDTQFQAVDQAGIRANNVVSWKFPPDQLPSLKRIVLHIDLENLKYMFAKSDFVHNGVENIWVEIDIINFTEQDLRQLLNSGFPVWTKKLAKFFPKASASYGVYLWNIVVGLSSSMLMDIHKFIPDLKDLKIHANYSFSTLAGIGLEDLLKFLEMGYSYENILREISIVDFKELKSLTIGRKSPSPMTNDLIKHCLGKISTLEYLNFSWGYYGLSAAEVGKALGHLRKMEIKHCNCDERTKQEIEKLAKMLPHVRVRRRTMDCC